MAAHSGGHYAALRIPTDPFFYHTHKPQRRKNWGRACFPRGVSRDHEKADKRIASVLARDENSVRDSPPNLGEHLSAAELSLVTGLRPCPLTVRAGSKAVTNPKVGKHAATGAVIAA